MKDPQMEQGVIDSFCRAIKRNAIFNKTLLESFSSSGQDRWLAGDYIFTDSTDFCLIEFKDNKNALSSESRKSIPQSLCKHLDANPEWKEVSRKCHHIAWEDNGDVISAPYIDIVCCTNHFKGLETFPEFPNFLDKRGSSMFSGAFGRRHLS